MENNKFRETFGRVDGKNVVDEIITFESEDNYSNRSIVAVVKFKSGPRYVFGSLKDVKPLIL